MANPPRPMSFLAIPSHVSRATSRESFASDASIISLNSFGSEIGNLNRQVSDLVLDDEPSDFEGTNMSEMLKYRENMLERMLETNALSIPKAASRKNSKNSPGKCKETFQNGLGMTESDDELLEECANNVILPRLFKSFSAGDLTGIIPLEAVKHCVSQAWIPSGYVLMLQCRRRHLVDFQRNPLITDFNAPEIPDIETPEESSITGLMLSSKLKADLQSEVSYCSSDRKASSAENVSLGDRRRASTGGPFLRRLRFSKEIGRKIRNDLLRKLKKHKEEKSITKVDLQREEGRPVTKNDRNFMIFHWLQSLDEDSFDQP